MYQLIYQFILEHLFNGSLSSYSTEIFGVSTNMNIWLSHSLTIISMILIFVFLVIFMKWLFRLASGLFLLK